MELDWVIGTSIGAINASLIAGNKFADRLVKLEEFWKRMERPSAGSFASVWPGLSDTWLWWPTVVDGIPAFFKPNLPAFWAENVPLGVDHAALYSQNPCQNFFLTCGLLDHQQGLAAADGRRRQVETSMMYYFYSLETPITTEHIMASGALPPTLLGIKIDDQFFSDGCTSFQHADRGDFLLGSATHFPDSSRSTCGI